MRLINLANKLKNGQVNLKLLGIGKKSFSLNQLDIKLQKHITLKMDFL